MSKITRYTDILQNPALDPYRRLDSLDAGFNWMLEKYYCPPKSMKRMTDPLVHYLVDWLADTPLAQGFTPEKLEGFFSAPEIFITGGIVPDPQTLDLLETALLYFTLYLSAEGTLSREQQEIAHDYIALNQPRWLDLFWNALPENARTYQAEEYKRQLEERYIQEQNA